jgi:hypothetical protein
LSQPTHSDERERSRFRGGPVHGSDEQIFGAE